MDLPQETDDYIKESIDYTLNLPVSDQTLEVKLRVSEDARRRLCDHIAVLRSKINEKDQLIERSKAETTMNAQALKKFIEENNKLATECTHLLNQCKKWERECSLYDHDRDALMEFGNEADQRAKEAEQRVHELEEEVGRLAEELQFYKREYDLKRVHSHLDDKALEDNLLESALSTFICNERATSAHAFLEVHNNQDASHKLMKMWDCLKPSTQKALSLAAKVKSLENDKEHLRVNLHRAEEEVKLLFEENELLDKENARLMRQCQKDKSQYTGSGDKQANNTPSKSNKRKSCAKTSSAIEMKIDFNTVDSARQPLSPLQHNSPDPKMQK